MKRLIQSAFLVLSITSVIVAQSRDTSIKEIDVNGKLYDGESFVVFITEQLEIKIKLNEGRFQVPACLESFDNTTVTFIVDKYHLNLGQLERDHFGQIWSISIDSFPFTAALELTPLEKRSLKLVYALTFASGGQMVFKVSK